MTTGAEGNGTSTLSMEGAAPIWVPSLIPGSLSCPGDPGGPMPHFIFLTSCSLWRLKRDSAQKNESLEAVPGDAGRCVLAQTHCLDWRGLTPLWIPAFKRAPHRYNCDLQPTGTEESSSNATQPFTPNSAPDASSTAWNSRGTGVKDGGSGLTAGSCSSLIFDSDSLETKGSTKLSPAKCPGQEAQLTNATDTEYRCCSWELLLVGAGTQGDGFCSFWELSADIAAGTRLWDTAVWYHWAEGGRKSPSQVWGADTQSRGVWAAHKQTDLHSCTETPGCSQASEQGYASDQLEKWLQCKSSAAAVLQLQKQHKFVKGPNHSQSVKKQDKDRGKIEMYCKAIILGYEFTF